MTETTTEYFKDCRLVAEHLEDALARESKRLGLDWYALNTKQVADLRASLRSLSRSLLVTNCDNINVRQPAPWREREDRNP